MSNGIHRFIIPAIFHLQPSASAIRLCADATSAVPMGAAPYHAMTARPRKAATQLNTSATMPFASNPLGRAAGLLLSPVKSKTSFVLPAALHWKGVFEF